MSTCSIKRCKTWLPSQFAVQDGALDLEGSELSFETGPDGKPRKVEGKAHLPMMAVVAEMMIFANAAVAHRIAVAFPGAALLRRHAPPRPDGFDQVSSCICTLDTKVVWPFRTSFCSFLLLGHHLLFLLFVLSLAVLHTGGPPAPLSAPVPDLFFARAPVLSVLDQVRCWGRGVCRSIPRWLLVLPTTGLPSFI